ncbi:MAG TPA: hypothetical protein VFM18_05250 [Methanosarcina sp.]|nr:hypothetical protein [Methanosarcina sp.]
MLKLIEIDSHYYQDEPNVRILNPGSANELVKQAADSNIAEFASKITAEAGRVYVHILAMGASEAWGANRNADAFPEQNLIEYHKTFETSPAHIFRNHVNKDPAIAIGQVVFSTYNTRMRRVELIAWIDKEKGRDIVERVERGEFPATSMACKTPYDVCSICGNEAHTRQEYCAHLSSELGRIYPDGRKVAALNVAPLKFFDMSIVVRPADVTSAVLQKVASAEPTVGSAELAEILGLGEKKASHAKLSEFIKEIDGGVVVDSSDSLDSIMGKVKDPSVDVIPHLNRHELGDVLNAMAHLGISPSIGFLADMIGHKIAGEDGIGVGSLIEGYILSNGISDLPIHDPDSSSSSPNPAIIDILMPHVKQASLLPEFVSQRSVSDTNGMYIPGTNIGYVGNGPHIEETPLDRWNRLVAQPEAKQKGGLIDMIKTLVTIGGAALAAKWYITKEIERKTKELSNVQQPRIKIVLVKSANDYRATYRLAKRSMAKAIQKV